jgi:hypothetical protein
MVLIANPERLDDTIGEIARVVLPGVRATDVHRPDVQRCIAMRDPLRHHEPDPAAGKYP